MLEFIYNIGTLATPSGKIALRSKAQAELSVRHNCYIRVENGVVTEIGDCAPGMSFPAGRSLDAQGKLVTPGLIDCHTHLVFGGWRHREFPLKLAGASYLEILESGGGILSTVRATREAGIGELCEKAASVLDEYLAYGVTTVEVKSGYGLDVETELKCLEAAKRLNEAHAVDIVSTFMGAHALPDEYKNDREAYVRLVCDEALPKSKGLADFCDVFCEKSAFSLEESEHILLAAQKLGYRAKIHAEEINRLGGAELAAKLGCVSAEHLIKIDEDGIKALASSGTVAVCLPCTSMYLNEDFAPAKTMIDAGCAVAVATDFNPGSSPNYNLQLAMSLACIKYRLSPEQVLSAVTLNAAAAIGRADTIGSIEPGKQADIAIWKVRELSEPFYRYGTNLVRHTVKRGVLVV